MRIIILTGDQFRHKYFANTIHEAVTAAALFSEGKVFNPSTDAAIKHGTVASGSKDDALWEWHFGLAREEEERFFGSHKDFLIEAASRHLVPKGEINHPEWADRIAAYKPDVIVVYGTSILKEPIITIAPERIFNMHLGLSPYYRGSGTNFWPLHNGEPEYVGVTIHLIDPGVDTGPIIHQGRPEATLDDNQHSLGNKAIEIGTQLMIQAIKEAEAGTIRFFHQRDKGKLYKRSDFSPANILHLKERMEQGLIRNYVARQAEVKANAPIIA